ncbi:MAG TPA: glycosyltransferase [Propionibacteriaceae bacterium]|nr:glycosyltransferase [Propionibacteriaceae bacterium]
MTTPSPGVEGTGRCPTYGVVILTMGRRPEDLQRAVSSVLAQRDVEVEVVVVGNGWKPVGMPPQVRTVSLEDNIGIPAGRNAGVSVVHGDLLFFLDDDAMLPTDDILATIAERFAADPRLGLLQPRIADPDGAPPPRRWTPRLRVGDPRRSSYATVVWEGAVAMRPEVFERAGGWADEFFYAHEGIDLTWRVWNTGAVAWYAGDIVVHHPANDPARNAMYYRYNARNRVYVARRNLPLPLIPVYLAAWTALTVIRLRPRSALPTWFAGFYEGVVTPCGERRPLGWRTVARMSMAGRPPIV